MYVNFLASQFESPHVTAVRDQRCKKKTACTGVWYFLLCIKLCCMMLSVT